MHTFGRSPVEFVEGHGMKLTGDDGREYLDFLAGIGVCSLGHGDPTKHVLGVKLYPHGFFSSGQLPHWG